MCQFFSDHDWMGALANAEMVFRRKNPVIYHFLKNSRLRCKLCGEEFTDFFEHYAEHMRMLAVETVVMNYYATCMSYVEVVGGVEGGEGAR